MIIFGCEGASAVATNPTPAAKCQPSVTVLSVTIPPNVGAAGGLCAVSIRTQPECAWNAATDVGWITDDKEKDKHKDKDKDKGKKKVEST